MISEELGYKDAWALKQTSWHFFRVIEIPTLRSFCEYFQDSPEINDRKQSERAKTIQTQWLEILVETNIFPKYEGTCKFCRCIATMHYFDKDQQHIRQHEKDFSKMMDMFCLTCGAENGLYQPGELVQCDSSPGLDQSDDTFYLSEELTLCYSCLRFVNFEGFEDEEGNWCGPCQFCKCCEACMRRSNAVLNNGLVERNSSQPCQHKEILGTYPDRTRQQGTVPGFSRLSEKPLWGFYTSLDYPTKWALAQTCHFFYSSMYVTTLRKFFDGRSLKGACCSRDLIAFRDWGIIPLDAQPCFYCKRFRMPRSDRIYHWKPLTHIDCHSYDHEPPYHFRWCYDCESNHGSVNGCTNSRDVYTHGQIACAVLIAWTLSSKP